MRVLALVRGLCRQRQSPAEDLGEAAKGPILTIPPADLHSRAEVWHLLGSSVVGTYHAENRQACEDASKAVLIDRGFILSVADGAGSASQAARGALLAVEAAVQAAVARLREGLPEGTEEWFGLLRDCVKGSRRALEQSEEPLDELATTLIVVVLQGETLAVAQVGDGCVVAEGEDGGLWTVSFPTKGEYFNETVFLSSEAYLRECSYRLEASACITGVAVLSDGLETVALDLIAQQPHPGFFEPLFAFARDPALTAEMQSRDLERFLASDRVNERTYDDKTLLLAVRHHGKKASNVVPAGDPLAG